MSKKENKKNKLLKRVLISIIVILFLIILFYLITNTITKYTGFFISEKEKFEKCLKDQDITLYINSYEVDKTLNSFEIKDYLANINIFNCVRNKDFCISNNINYFPTLINENNNKKIEGELSLDALKEFSGCR